MAYAILARRPVHCLVGYVYGRKFVSARRFEQEVIAGLAASQHGGPAVGFSDIGVHQKLGRNESQHTANDDALYDVRNNCPLQHIGSTFVILRDGGVERERIYLVQGANCSS